MIKINVPSIDAPVSWHPAQCCAGVASAPGPRGGGACCECGLRLHGRILCTRSYQPRSSSRRTGASSLMELSAGCFSMRSSMSSVGDLVVALAFAAFGDLPPFTRLGDEALFSGWTAMVTCVERGVWRVPRRVPTQLCGRCDRAPAMEIWRERMSASSREVRETFRGPFSARGCLTKDTA